jgi:hypothetical protein
MPKVVEFSAGTALTVPIGKPWNSIARVFGDSLFFSHAGRDGGYGLPHEDKILLTFLSCVVLLLPHGREG